MEKRIAHIDEFFGQIIAIKRKRLGYDQSELAAMLGINQPALSRIERGESAVNITMLIKLADKLNTTPAMLIEEFESEKTRLEASKPIIVVPKSELPKNDSNLGLLILGGIALAALLSSGSR